MVEAKKQVGHIRSKCTLYEREKCETCGKPHIRYVFKCECGQCAFVYSNAKHGCFKCGVISDV